ncbi:aminotransferase class V-fold PLP-dependent enzyme [Mycoplasma buteonis]|uniref:aminotransferase class V-fold PLP-dependent enzyme n=1 Tax=Mycoplasma buteonis TaxID=171280 RepID=UPI000567BFE4|nr:aminotransferase class V-fold PLP-dependent enzyme [Mycoplasma buteonis]
MQNKEIRNQFPLANQITYFDNAALVLKPQSAIDAVTDFYTNKSISSRTADTPLGNEVNNTLHRVREKVATLLDCQSSEIIFTSGTTESLNNFAWMVEPLLNEGDEILLSVNNHSSNIVPWIEVAKKTGAKVVYSEDIESHLSAKTKILAISQESNNFQNQFEFDALIAKARSFNAIIVADAAQAIIHQKVSLQKVDVAVFSCNKFYGPTGLGVLAIRKNLLAKLSPAKFGGGSITEIKKDSTWGLRQTITAFEPGTPNLAAFFMFDKALDFFNSVGYQKTQNILEDLSQYLHSKLAKLSNVKVYSNPGDYIAILNVKGIHPQDVATYLGSKNIYTRAGIFCALYMRNVLTEDSFLRISLAIYNTYEDIDKLVYELEHGGDFYAF